MKLCLEHRKTEKICTSVGCAFFRHKSHVIELNELNTGVHFFYFGAREEMDFITVVISFYQALTNPLGLLDVSGEAVCHRALIINSFHFPDIGKGNRNII